MSLQCSLKSTSLLAGGDTFSGQPISLRILGDFLTNWVVAADSLTASQQAWHVVPHLTSLTSLMIDDTSDDTDTDSLPDMKELRALTRLRTLALQGYADLAKQVHNFTNIQELELSYGRTTLMNLSCLNLLTALTLEEEGPRCFQTLILPEGKEVRLQKLSMSCMGYEPENRFEMHNLQMAVQLASLHLVCIDPDNLREGGWPQTMPCLSDLTLHFLVSCPPSQLQFYPMLQRLDLSHIEVNALPDWVSNLTQLQHLSLNSGMFEQGFPEIVLELSQLQTLDLQLMGASILPQKVVDCVLPGKVVECAAWPNLFMLNLQTRPSASYKFMSSLDSHIVLLLLMKAFKDAGKRSPLVLDKVYIE